MLPRFIHIVVLGLLYWTLTCKADQSIAWQYWRQACKDACIEDKEWLQNVTDCQKGTSRYEDCVSACWRPCTARWDGNTLCRSRTCHNLTGIERKVCVNSCQLIHILQSKNLCNHTEDCDLRYVVNDLRDETCKLKKTEIMKNSPCTCNLKWEPYKTAEDYEVPATAELAYDGKFKLNIKWKLEVQNKYYQIRYVIVKANSSTTYCLVTENNSTNIVLNESRLVLRENFNPDTVKGINVLVLKIPSVQVDRQDINYAKLSASAKNELFPKPTTAATPSPSLLESTSSDFSISPVTSSGAFTSGKPSETILQTYKIVVSSISVVAGLLLGFVIYQYACHKKSSKRDRSTTNDHIEMTRAISNNMDRTIFGLGNGAPNDSEIQDSPINFQINPFSRISSRSLRSSSTSSSKIYDSWNMDYQSDSIPRSDWSTSCSISSSNSECDLLLLFDPSDDEPIVDSSVKDLLSKLSLGCHRFRLNNREPIFSQITKAVNDAPTIICQLTRDFMMTVIKTKIDSANHSTLDGNKIEDRIIYAWNALVFKYQSYPHSIIFVRKPEISNMQNDIENQFKCVASCRDGWKLHIYDLHIDNKDEYDKVTELLRSCPAAKNVRC